MVFNLSFEQQSCRATFGCGASIWLCTSSFGFSHCFLFHSLFVLRRCVYAVAVCTMPRGLVSGAPFFSIILRWRQASYRTYKHCIQKLVISSRIHNPWYLLTGQKTVDAHGFRLLVKDRISLRAFGHAVLCENSRRQDSFLAAGEGSGACCSEARWLIAGACA